MPGFMEQICEPFTKRQRDILTAREWLGNETWKECNKDYESLLAFKKTIKRKPDIYQQAELALNEVMINHYKNVLFHNMWRHDCTCRDCELLRQELAKYKFIPEHLLEKMRMKGWI